MRAIFVMIRCELGCAYQVANHLMDEIQQTSEVHSISGEFDLLAKFRLDSEEDIGRFVCETVQPSPGIAATFTIISLNPFTQDHGRFGDNP